LAARIGCELLGICKDPAMIIECPSCGVPGNLPSHIPTGANALRCRRCGVRFEIGDRGDKASRRRRDPILMTRFVIGARVDEEVVAAVAPGEPDPWLRDSTSPALMPSNGYFAGFDDEEPGTHEGGPGDSHYELSDPSFAAFEDSGAEWTAVSTANPAPRRSEAASNGEPVASEAIGNEPWYYKLIDSFGRYQFLVALNFGALVLVLFGFLLVRPLIGNVGLDSSASALLVGLVGTVAFLLISLITAALIVLLVDLARTIRRLRLHVDRNAPLARE
jgi:hypothetical protein